MHGEAVDGLRQRRALRTGGVMRLGIVGGGLAGLATALAAAIAGAQVEVFETASPPDARAAHLDVVPNLMRDLARLGVADDCARHGFPYRGFSVVDGSGRLLSELPTLPLAGPHRPAALGIAWPALLDVLATHARARGATLHTGAPVREVDAQQGIVTDDGVRHSVDLVVVAAGHAPPRLAGAAARPMAVEALPQVWCHALLPRPPALQRGAWVIGRGTTRAYLVPVAMRSAGVALLRPAEAPRDGASLRRLLDAEGGLLRAFAAHWHDDTPVALRPVRSGVLDGPWHAGGVLRIGESAHLLPPHFGQAAAQSVEDAVVLGDLLRDGLPRDALLAAFDRRRAPRARQVQALVAQAARWQLQPDADTDLPSLHARLHAIVAEPA